MKKVFIIWQADLASLYEDKVNPPIRTGIAFSKRDAKRKVRALQTWQDAAWFTLN